MRDSFVSDYITKQKQGSVHAFLKILEKNDSIRLEEFHLDDELRYHLIAEPLDIKRIFSLEFKKDLNQLLIDLKQDIFALYIQTQIH
jgi:hypothetical protein